LLNLGQLIRYLTLSHLLYVYATIYITAKGIIFKTKTKVIETSPSQCLTLYLSPVYTVQGRHLISAPLGRLSRASLAVVLENQTHPNLDNIRYTYTVNFTQFYKPKKYKSNKNLYSGASRTS
jgi:hypothetical protein